jgi:cytochrome oxidase Cu insertion factor (SCO1/SenC/PrrC family)
MLIVAAAVAVAVGLGLGFLIPITKPDSVVTRPAIGGPFALVNQFGQPVTDKSFAGRHMLVYFGYTYCPDVCPTELQVMSNALDLLGEPSKAIDPVFITIDPERDTVEQMKTYSTHFHPRLQALTGTSEQVKAAAKAYGVYFARARDTGATTEYLMDHSSIVFLIGPDGGYVTHFRGGTSPEDMAKQIRRFL